LKSFPWSWWDVEPLWAVGGRVVGALVWGLSASAGLFHACEGQMCDVIRINCKEDNLMADELGRQFLFIREHKRRAV
jgi:hypothetical protein